MAGSTISVGRLWVRRMTAVTGTPCSINRDTTRRPMNPVAPRTTTSPGRVSRGGGNCGFGTPVDGASPAAPSHHSITSVAASPSPGSGFFVRSARWNAPIESRMPT